MTGILLLVLLLGAAEVSAQTRDLEGFWATSTLTPLERPPEFAGKTFFTEKEAAEYEKRTLEAVNSDRRDGGPDADLRRNYNEFWRDRATTVLPSRRTSIIVDPPDGKIPPFTPDWQRKRAGRIGVAHPLHLARPADDSHTEQQLPADHSRSRLRGDQSGDDARVPAHPAG
jgi:hypothetical protein